MFISHAFIPECCSLYLYLYVYHIDGMLAYFSGDVCKSEDNRIRMTGLIRTIWLTVVSIRLTVISL